MSDPLSRRPSFLLELGRASDLGRTLDAAWRHGLKSGLVAYDPAGGEVAIVEQPPYRYHYLPSRATRPGAHKRDAPPPEGLRLPHVACPFDDPSFVGEREVVRLERSGRVYHLVANRYPVTPFHFLPVRSADAPPGELTQHVHAPHEIEDLLLILAMTGPPYHVYFNSNRGRDDSQSGSSVNHWHGQLFPLKGDAGGLFRASARLLRFEEGLEVGRIDPWPAHHVLVDGRPDEFTAIAEVIWREVSALNEVNSAYNLEAAFTHGDRIRAFLFPRRPAPAATVPGAGPLSSNFGGWELTGDIVIPTREILEWIAGNPRAAHELTTRRLQETTRLPSGG